MQAILDKVEQREWVTFENAQQQIFGILHRPTYTERPPVVLLMHGFASSKYGSNRCYVKIAEALAKAGIAALRFDFRGAGDSEGDLASLSFNDLVSDAVCVFESLDRVGGVDFDRVGIFGASMGGAIAVLSTALHHQTQALALWAPVASGEQWVRDFLMKNPELAHQDPFKALKSHRGIVLNDAFKQQFAQMSAAHVLGTLDQIPVLHMHGENDAEVTQSHQELYRRSCKNGQFMTYPEAEHSLGFASVFPEVLDETVRWFKQKL